MDADGTLRRGPPGRRYKKPQKLKFKPKVPAQKPKKSTPEKPQQEEPKPIDEELVKRLRTGKGAPKTLPSTKDEHSAQNLPSMLSSAAGVDLSLPQSGGQKQGQPVALQIPRVFPVTSNPGIFYDHDDDDDDDDDEDDGNVELQETQPSSTECETSIRPAKELNLLEEDDKRRMFLFQLPKSLPLPRIPSAVAERNGKTISKEVKERYNLKDLPGGYLGKMLVYKSGEIKMKLGDVMFDVNPGAECGMAQHAVAMNTREKHCCLLGEIENRHVVVTPDVDSLLNDNRG